MKHYARGYACNLNDLFIKFPYEKCKKLCKLPLKLAKLKQVFRYGLHLILTDIIENNTTFMFPKKYIYSAMLHIDAIRGEDFRRARKNGKFKGVDFLETNFTGYRMCLSYWMEKNSLHPLKKVEVHIGNQYTNRLNELVNQGKQYC